MNKYVNKRVPNMKIISEEETKVCQIFMYYLVEEHKKDKKEIEEIRKARKIER